MQSFDGKIPFCPEPITQYPAECFIGGDALTILDNTHIGVYAALLQYRIQAGFINPIQAFSREIMDIAKISSAMTYYKCVRDLSNYGYIRYEPSFSHTKGSRIFFVENQLTETT